MPVSNLGRIGFVPKGDWVAGTYKYLDVVKHNQGTWICAVPTTTQAPVAGGDWQNALSVPKVSGVSNWSELSGAQAPPLIVYDDLKYWALTAPVSNIASNKPAESPEFFMPVNDSPIDEAPIDGKKYVRQDGAWTLLYPKLSSDGSNIDGLTFDAMVAAGKYDHVTDTGFFGEVPAATLFTGPQIASQIGLTAGTAQHNNEPWLKFYVGSNAKCNRNEGTPYILYIAKKPYRNNISWDQINARGAVYWGAGATVQKAGHTLDVGLLFGANADPANSTNAAPLSTANSCAANHGEGSHWNDLIYRVMAEVPTCPSPDTYHGGPQIGANWASYQNTDLIIASGDGRYTWCQETSAITGTHRVIRGSSRLSHLSWFTSSLANSNTGFRPALRLS